MYRRLYIIANSRYFFPALVLLAFLLYLPGLFGPYMLDDYIFQFIVLHSDGGFPKTAGAIFGCYSFTNGQADNIRQAVNMGALPWWASPGFKIAFWRPLAELSMWVDFTFWPKALYMSRLHSFAWFVLALWQLRLVLKRLIPARSVVQGLILVLVAIDSANTLPVYWLSNRYAIMVLAFSLASFNYFLRWRKYPKARHFYYSMGLLVLSFLTGEATVSILPFFVAYLLLLDKKSPANRLKAFLPFLLLFFLWRITYVHLGYGQENTLVYIDPFVHTGLFFTTLPVKLLGAITSLFANPLFSDNHFYYNILLPSRFIFVITIVPAIAGLLWHYLPKNRTVLFLALSMLGAVVPSMMSVPHVRLLGLASIAANGLIVLFVFDYFYKKKYKTSRWKKWPAFMLIAFFAFNHVAMSAHRIPELISTWNERSRTELDELSWSVPIDNGTRNLIAINIPHNYFIFPFHRTCKGLAWADHTLVLSIGPNRLSVSKSGPYSLDFAAPNGLIRDGYGVFRLEEEAFAVGDSVELGWCRIDILQTNAQRNPTHIRLKLLYQPESGMYDFAAHTDCGYVRFDPPGQGDTLHF